jgi:crotonobetainyl-CoA:carnitine CoA-transferase CaiB-like acyl-CoA transferase
MIEAAQPQAEGGAGPLAGIRVLDLSSVVMGPYATQLLGDQGADVIVVEAPSGLSNRSMGPGPDPEFSGIALNLLRNKRSVGLDLKDPAGREAVLKIAAGCDVLVTNLRPKTLAGLGLSYEDVRKARPDIIYCQAQGFRGDSPRADDPAYDDIIQAESGVADAARRIDGTPRLAPTIMADKVCGLTIVYAVLAGLLHRAKTGAGQRIEVPMADVMRSFMLVEHGAGAICDSTMQPGYARVLSANRGPQKTSDGWINILPYSSAAYDALFEAGSRNDLVGDPRTRGPNLIHQADFLYGELRPVIASRTTAEWLDFCDRNGIPVGRIVDLAELVGDLPLAEHPVAGSYRTIPSPVVFTGSPVGEPRSAPRHGQDTRRVLHEAGIQPEKIDDLFTLGVAREAEQGGQAHGGQAHG